MTTNTINEHDTPLVIPPEVEKRYSVKWNPADFTMTALNGQFRASPEILIDFQAYYEITPEVLLEFVSKTLQETGYTEEVDICIHFDWKRTFRPEKETIFSIFVRKTKDKELLGEVKYFSSLPMKRNIVSEAKQ